MNPSAQSGTLSSRVMPGLGPTPGVGFYLYQSYCSAASDSRQEVRRLDSDGGAVSLQCAHCANASSRYQNPCAFGDSDGELASTCSVMPWRAVKCSSPRVVRYVATA